MAKKVYLNLCSKTATRKDGTTFPTYFGYFKDLTPDGFVDHITRNINGKVVGCAYRCVPHGATIKSLIASNSFPYMLELTEDKDFYILADKNPDGTMRFTKDGKPVYVLILESYTSLISKNEHKHITIDDLD